MDFKKFLPASQKKSTRENQPLQNSQAKVEEFSSKSSKTNGSDCLSPIHRTFKQAIKEPIPLVASVSLKKTGSGVQQLQLSQQSSAPREIGLNKSESKRSPLRMKSDWLSGNVNTFNPNPINQATISNNLSGNGNLGLPNNGNSNNNCQNPNNVQLSNLISNISRESLTINLNSGQILSRNISLTPAAASSHTRAFDSDNTNCFPAEKRDSSPIDRVSLMTQRPSSTQVSSDFGKSESVSSKENIEVPGCINSASGSNPAVFTKSTSLYTSTGSQVQKSKIDLAITNSNKHQKGRSNSMARNMSVDEKKRMFEKKASVRDSADGLKHGVSSSNSNVYSSLPSCDLKGIFFSGKKSSRSNVRTSTNNNNSNSASSNLDASNIILEQALYNRENTSNIRVFGRFRPFNKTETELATNGLGGEFCIFPREDTVVILPDNQVYTLDKVFPPNTKQEKVFEQMGYETIIDVLNGYNGTIFTYGQTGSGKTYTMFGDIHDSEQAGMIPRSIKLIFDSINKCELDIEYTLNCSMLEIYKETLSDLLSKHKTDLKIKESPSKGIYIEGLTQISVANEEELLHILEIGDQMRTVAATRINQYSSRSHTIFTIEIKQNFPNETEKKGKLNLVDLAGSEKVGKTGAMGETLEEAKKINLSLSCLGNVIHALTSNCDHIPYRDSKLTRILQESLGGNYKTSLMVTCSTHSSSAEETMSTMKFASRAKTIRNHFKMNIKNSPDTLQRVIEQLRKELMRTKAELGKYQSNKVALTEGNELINNEKDGASSNIKSEERKEDLLTDPSSDYCTKNINLISNSRTEGPFIDLIQKKELLEMRVLSQDRELESLNSLLKESENNYMKIEEEVVNLKKESLKYEKRISEVTEERDNYKMKYENVATNFEGLKRQIDIQRRQIEGLTESLSKNDASRMQMIEEKKEWSKKYINVQKGFEELMNLKKIPFHSISFTDYLNHTFENCLRKTQSQDQTPHLLNDSEPQNKNPNFEDSYISGVELTKLFQRPSQNIAKIMEIPTLSFENVQSILNGESPLRSFSNGSEAVILSSNSAYYLKMQLFNSFVFNQNLERTLHELEAKQIVEFGKARIKSEILKMQENHIKNFEKILEKARISHQQLRNRVETVEFEAIRFREKILDTETLDCHSSKRSRITRTFSKKKNKKQQQQQQYLLQLQQQPQQPQTQLPAQSQQLNTDKSFENLTGEVLFRKTFDEAHTRSLEEFIRRLQKQVEELFYDNDVRELEEAKQIFTRNNALISQIYGEMRRFVLEMTGTKGLGENSEWLSQTQVSGFQTSMINDHTLIIQEEVLKSENIRMQNKILILLSELDFERCKSEKLQEAHEQAHKELDKYKQLVEEVEWISRETLKREHNSWENLYNEFKKTMELELGKKIRDCQRYRTLIEENLPNLTNLLEEFEETTSIGNNDARRPSSESISSKKALLHLSNYSNLVNQSPLSVKSGSINIENSCSATNPPAKETPKATITFSKVTPPPQAVIQKPQPEKLKKGKPSHKSKNSNSNGGQELGFRYNYNFENEKMKAQNASEDNKK